jgi:sphingomyelin phosphodiesterase
LKFLRGAFYSIKLFSNMRLISLNTNYCAQLNFWLYVNSTDPLGKKFEQDFRL